MDNLITDIIWFRVALGFFFFEEGRSLSLNVCCCGLKTGVVLIVWSCQSVASHRFLLVIFFPSSTMILPIPQEKEGLEERSYTYFGMLQNEENPGARDKKAARL